MPLFFLLIYFLSLIEYSQTMILKIFNICVFVIASVFLTSCNKNLTEAEKKELWSNAQTTGQIIERSGTVFNSASDKELALDDAENRLNTGGGLFGKKSLDIASLGKSKGTSNTTMQQVGLPINPYFWKASLETIDFMPLASADPFAGIIITDWYSLGQNKNERCKLNIFIKGVEMKTDNLKVNSFCQKNTNGTWTDIPQDKKINIQIENTILNKAKKIRISQG